MTDDRTERDDRELAEDLEPTAEAAGNITGGRSKDAPPISEIVISKPIDKPSP
jgi:hypothetical protein